MATTTTWSDEEWEATIRYGDEHAGEFEHEDLVARYTETADLAKHIFDLAVSLNRAAAESLRRVEDTL